MAGKRLEYWSTLCREDLESRVAAERHRVKLSFAETQLLEAAQGRLSRWRAPFRTGRINAGPRPSAEGPRGSLRGAPRRTPQQQMELSLMTNTAVEETTIDNKSTEEKPPVKKKSSGGTPKRARGPDLKGADTVEKLVTVYNELVAEASKLGIEEHPVSSFAVFGAGKKACETLHAQIEKSRSVEGSSDMRKSSSARKSTTRKGPSARGRVKAVSKTSGKNPRSRLDPDAKVTWTGKDNPFREGSDAFKRVEIVRKSSGQSVKTIQHKLGDYPTVNTTLRMGLVKIA